MDIKELLRKYKKDELDKEEQKLLEQYIEEGIISLEELGDTEMLHKKINEIQMEIPSMKMTSRFHEMLSNEKSRVGSMNLWDRIWNYLAKDLPVVQFYRLAYSVSILLFGLFIGWLINPVGKYQEQISTINAEVLEMKEMMMLSMLEKPSVTDRLKAVSMSADIPAGYVKVIDALFNTLNHDDNVNVRLAALEALSEYARDPVVRENLVKSISEQQSPLVQIEMADLMVALQEKRSVEELKKIIERENTDPGVKEQLNESIAKIS
jgi:hypothetical protein